MVIQRIINYLGKYSPKKIYFFIKNIMLERKIEREFFKVYKTNAIPTIGIEKESSRKIVISLTSYPGRFSKLHLVLYSLLTQTTKPNRVVLVLSKREVKSETEIPPKVLFLRRLGLEIKFAEKNYRSYNKLIHTLKDFPEFNIITIDDDIIYPRWFLEKLYLKHKEYPKDIICYRAHLIKKSLSKIKTYLDWFDYDLERFSQGANLFPTGVGGVLYPPKCLNKEVFNSKAFLKICPLNDDVWFKAMSLLNQTNCRRVFKNKNIEPLPLRGTQKTRLSIQNVGLNKNDEQIKNVFTRYFINKYLSTTN